MKRKGEPSTDNPNYRWVGYDGLKIFPVLKEEIALKLPTKRLLTYYKRNRHKWTCNFICACCHEWTWDIGKQSIGMKDAYEELTKYFQDLKSELDTREHVNT